MDDEKLEKTMEFILNNQAQFYADLQQIQEVQKEAEKRVNVLERACLNLYNTTVEQGKNIAEQGENISELTADVKELRDAQKSTDERLNAVIFMAEKYFSGENGKKKK